MPKRYAAIDLGSNSCRLSIVDETGKEVFHNGISVRLGEGLIAEGILSEEAISRAAQCFFDFRQEMDIHNVEAYHAVATAAARKAKNADALIKAIKNESGIELDIISGEEEARLTLLGALGHADKSKKYILAFDSGGGSTEISLATNTETPKIIHSTSIPWGGRNASEKFKLAEYSQRNADKFRKELKGYLDKFIEDSNFDKYADSISFIGASSTPLRLAAAFHEFEKYERGNSDGYEIEVQKVEPLLNAFYKKSVSELAQSPYVGQNRSSIFVASCLIFETVAKTFEMDKVVASLGSVKEGVVRELIKLM
ncbi:MAG: hypothetical protein PHE89_06715 [Alphaproteobacteria bacterium]|nr:hypothetical protein [Alphaproteobacteria bacterium]